MGLAVAVLALLRAWPAPPLSEHASLSRMVLAEDGELLRMTLAEDGQYRLWVPLQAIAPAMQEAILLKEDRTFYWHPGIDPKSLLRALFSTYSGASRQGGSTLTMQLARRLYGLESRRIPGKLAQMALALWLEARYSKAQILEAYLNLAPMGGNLEGVETASRIYFGKPAAQLSLAEALALAVIPQQPTARGRFGDNLERARRSLVAKWRQQYPEDPRNALALELPVQARARRDLPFLAPHLSEQLLAQSRDLHIHSHLSWPLQQLLEQQITAFLAARRGSGLENALALLVDGRNGEVKALVGSADYFNRSISGQVNGVRAQRSPGSTLKPFIYGLALDAGLIHPMSMLKDAPTAFGHFQPENYDGRFVGPVTAQQALISSRNVPAVWLASQLRDPSLHGLLQRAGVRNLQPESHYGLSLALGGGEISPEELARLYLALAGDGRLRALRYWQGQPGADDTVRLLSPQAAFIVRDMLRHNPRPDGLPADARGDGPVAWKTGTSWGFHDAWSAGLVGPYVLVVWLGNFDGRGNPALIGQKAAAPLFFRIADALRIARPDARSGWPSAVEGVKRVEVCRASGELPNRWCPQTRSTWFIPGVSPIRVSDLHRPLPIDSRSGKVACAGLEAAYIHEEVFEFWPSDLLQLFQAAGLPRRTPPPFEAGCQPPLETAGGMAPRIVSPRAGLTYSLRLSQADASLPLEAVVDSDARHLYWFAGAALIAEGPVGQALSWRPAHGGNYRLRVSDDQGRSRVQTLQVEFLP